MKTAIRLLPISAFGLAATALSACSPSAPSPVVEVQATNAPSYQELFAQYFAPGTAGHCATAGCHADPGHNVWLCTNAKTCYEGMLSIGLVDAVSPTDSDIADPQRSPLVWFNPAGGNMPLDAQVDNAAGRAAVEAWIAAGAPED